MNLMNLISGGSSGSSSGGTLSQLGDLAKYASLLEGGGNSNSASSASISTILGMLQSGPSTSHATKLPTSNLQGIFMQIMSIKQG
jgi:hypothetical protein